MYPDGPVTALDYGALRGAETAITAAAADLDQAGGRAPDGDYGEAAPLIAVVLSVYAEAASRLVAEAKVVGLAVGVAAGDLRATDAQQAVQLLEIGR